MYMYTESLNNQAPRYISECFKLYTNLVEILDPQIIKTLQLSYPSNPKSGG